MPLITFDTCLTGTACGVFRSIPNRGSESSSGDPIRSGLQHSTAESSAWLSGFADTVLSEFNKLFE